MSGVFGCWHLDARPLDAASLHRPLASISPFGGRGIRAWTSGAIGLGLKSTPAVGESAASCLLGFEHTACVFDGRLDNPADLRRLLQDHPLVTTDCGDRELALAAYERFGESFVERLEGDFALAAFDARTNRLLLARDRVGLRPLCYTQQGGTFLFASEAKSLLAWPGVAAAPDEEALADFLLYFPSRDTTNRTCFAGIHALPPAHALVVTPHGASLRRYFDFDATRSVRFASLGDYVDAFRDLFRGAVRSRLRSPDPVAVSVSGGLDSAYIFCVAHRLIRDEPGLCPAVIGVNYRGLPGTPSDEREYVGALAAACGATIAAVDQRAGFMACARDEAWISESPMVETLANQAQAGLGAVRTAGAGRFLTGHWGDQLLFDSDYLVDLVRAGRLPSARRHARGWGIGVGRLAWRCARDAAARRMPAAVVPAIRRVRGRGNAVWESPWFTPRFRRLLRDRAAHARRPGAGGTRHARAIYQQCRSSYHVQCMEWNARIGAMHGIDMAFPYLDARLIEFLMAIPGDVQSHDGMPRGLMRAAMRGIVPDVIVDRRGKGEFTHLANASIEHDFPAIRELLGTTSLSAQFGLIDGATLLAHLDSWRADIRTAHDTVLATRVVNLCGLELFLRRFFGDEAGAADAPPAEPMLAAC